MEITQINVRFALFLHDVARGEIGLFPTLNGEPYTDYLSPMTLLTSVITFGDRFVNQWSLSLLSIFSGTYTIAMTYLIGEHLRKGTGFIAALMLLFCFEFVTNVLTFGIDLPVAAARSPCSIFWNACATHTGIFYGLPFY